MLTKAALDDLSSSSGSIDELEDQDVALAASRNGTLERHNSSHNYEDAIRPYQAATDSSTGATAAQSRRITLTANNQDETYSQSSSLGVNSMVMELSRPVSPVDDPSSPNSQDGIARVWYFAYGSNMNVAQLLTRVGSYGEKRLLMLEDYRLVFNKKVLTSKSSRLPEGLRPGYANVEPQNGSIVCGVAYSISEEQLIKMDRYEGVSTGHYSRTLLQARSVDDPVAPPISVWVYFACDAAKEDGLKPYDSYLNDILGGRGVLPKWYVEQLERVETLSVREVMRYR